VYGHRINNAELDVVSSFENIFDIPLVQLIVDETTIYARQEISKSVCPFTFCSRIRRKWENVRVDEMYVVLVLLC
jgi:hypothetical protein